MCWGCGPKKKEKKRKYYLSVLEAGSPRSRCPQDRFPPEASLLDLQMAPFPLRHRRHHHHRVVFPLHTPPVSPCVRMSPSKHTSRAVSGPPSPPHCNFIVFSVSRYGHVLSCWVGDYELGVGTRQRPRWEPGSMRLNSPFQCTLQHILY